MKASIDGKTYTIEFVHGSRFQWNISTLWTACLIRDITYWPKPPLVAPAPVVAMGEYTWTHPNREIARKKALAIAVKELFPSESTGRSQEVKQKRYEIWFCYFDRKKRPAKPVIPESAPVWNMGAMRFIAIGALMLLLVANLFAIHHMRRYREQSRAIEAEITAKLERFNAEIAAVNASLLRPPNHRMFHAPPEGCPGITVKIPYMFERDGRDVPGCLNPDATNETIDFLRPGESVVITHMFLAPSPSGDGAMRFSGERR